MPYYSYEVQRCRGETPCRLLTSCVLRPISQDFFINFEHDSYKSLQEDVHEQRIVDDVGIVECLECINETFPTITTEAQAERAASEFNPKAGSVFTKHLKCPYCPNYYSSLPALRLHKLTKHTEEYNRERKDRSESDFASQQSTTIER